MRKMDDGFLASIEDIELDGMTKGLPLAGRSLRLGDVGRQGWNVLAGDMTVPLLTLRESAVRKNARVMRSFLQHAGVSLAPHGKTMMSPQLYRLMLEEGGAWGITAATVQQAAVVAASGAPNVILANEVVGRANVEQLALLKRNHPQAAFYSLVDSPETVAALVSHGASHLDEGARFQVLAEVGTVGGRTGARTAAAARDLLAAIAAGAEAVELAGIECFEGLIARESPQASVAAVDGLLDFAVETFVEARTAGAFAGREEVLLTAGGSAFFDRVAARFSAAAREAGARVVLRGGCYLTYDHGIYRRQLEAMDARGGLEGAEGHITAARDFEPALELWAAVESLHDPGVAVITLGRRDMADDSGWPIPLRHYREAALVRELSAAEPPFQITHANDQHGFLAYPQGADLRVGDLLAFGISHPCTTFDRWDVLYRVSDGYDVTGAIKTYF